MVTTFSASTVSNGVRDQAERLSEEGRVGNPDGRGPHRVAHVDVDTKRMSSAIDTGRHGDADSCVRAASRMTSVREQAGWNSTPSSTFTAST